MDAQSILANIDPSKAQDQPQSGGPVQQQCGDIDMRIARDGTWFYMGTPIGRQALVKLFSTVIRLEDDGDYYLVTPVEKARIKVDDAPFTAVELLEEGEGRDQKLSFRINVDQEIPLDADHPLTVEQAQDGEPSPYILVRYNLRALVMRSVFYHLVERAVPSDEDPDTLGVWSNGIFFPIGSVDG